MRVIITVYNVIKVSSDIASEISHIAMINISAEYFKGEQNYHTKYSWV